MPLSRLLSFAAVTVLVLFALAAYPALPERIPTHLDVSGRVTTISDRSVWSWFGLTMAGVGAWGAVMAIGPRSPFVSYPHRPRFLALSAPQQAFVEPLIRARLDRLAAVVALLVLALQVEMLLLARGLGFGPVAPSTIGLVGVVLAVGAPSPAIRRAVEAAEAAAVRDGPAGGD